MNITKLYKRVLNKEISEYAFVQEMSKYPQYSKYKINNFPTLVTALKRDRVIIMEQIDIVPPQPTTIQRLDFGAEPLKTIHIISVAPNSFEYICNDKHRKVGGDDFKKFLDTMYKDMDSNPDDEDDLGKASEFILQNQDNIDNYPVVKTDYAVQDLDEMKRTALRVVTPKPIQQQLNESDYDLVSSHSFSIGFPIEFDKLKDVDKARDRVVKNLLKNEDYYIELLTGKKREDSNRNKPLTKDNLVDKENGNKIIRVLNENHIDNVISKLNEGEYIVGGLGDNKQDNQFDNNQLRLGTKVEMKHSVDINRAKELAKDNLTKDTNYYTKLKRVGLQEFEGKCDYKVRLKEELENYLKETGKPSSGLSTKEKSDIVKKAKAGKDFGKKGVGFEKIVKNVEKAGYDEKVAQKVAGANFWKNLKR